MKPIQGIVQLEEEDINLILCVARGDTLFIFSRPLARIVGSSISREI